MLLILFKVGDFEYGLASESIVEIVPNIKLIHIPGAPNYVVGVFNYRGDIVPVVDLAALLNGAPSRERLSTRIAVYKIKTKKGEKLEIGLMAESMTDTLEVDKSFLQQNKNAASKESGLGLVLQYENKYIQYLELERLIKEHDLESLLKKQNPKAHEAS